jgi:hypothetical protein
MRSASSIKLYILEYTIWALWSTSCAICNIIAPETACPDNSSCASLGFHPKGERVTTSSPLPENNPGFQASGSLGLDVRH